MDRKILNLRYNQDQGCFSCSMESGVRIYNVEPLAEKTHYDVDLVGSISQCEMLYRSNLLAMVSGGSRPLCSDNILRIFDDITKKFILEIAFPADIKSVRLAKDKIVVALPTKIHVFSFPSPTQLLFSIDTFRNPKGLLEISPASADDRQLLIFPGCKTGGLQIWNVLTTETSVSTKTVWINAHDHELAAVAFNQLATKIATASAKGTLIRVWDVATKNQIIELRRGSDAATIYCLNFSINADFLCCSSDKGTIHVFAITNPSRNKSLVAQGSTVFGKYISSQWAFATFTVGPEKPCMCAFSRTNNYIIAICTDGTYHKYVFGQGQSCKRVGFDVFLDVYSDEDGVI